MIARIWRGAVGAEDAAEYAAYVEKTGITGYKRTPGNIEKAVFYPEDDRFLVERDLQVTHYEVPGAE